jgi:hypothetical protein
MKDPHSNMRLIALLQLVEKELQHQLSKSTLTTESMAINERMHQVATWLQELTGNG